MGTNGNTPTPQEIMGNAVKSVNNMHSGNSVTVAEISVKLADAQARLHAANQAEVDNLMKVLESDRFSSSVRENASARILALLGLD